MKPCLFFLTCADESEALKITETLLKKHLVVCIKKIPVSSLFLFQGKIDSGKEVMLIMDSVEENFKKTDKEVRQIHSYETYVFLSVPVSQTTPAVLKWMKEEII